MKVNLSVRRSIRLTASAELNAAKEELLMQMAARYQERARQLAAVPFGLGSGIKTGALQRAIKVAAPHLSPQGKSLSVVIYADLELAPHALWQEAGTGLYRPGGGDWIRPRRAQVMHWEQVGQPYRSSFVRALLSGVRLRAGKTVKVYDQFAYKVRGVRPKWYMRQTRNAADLRQSYRKAVAALSQRYLQRTTGHEAR